MKVAICGGTGFLGSHIVRRLKQDGHELLLVSRGKVRRRRKDVSYIRADVVKGDGLEDAFQGCDAVINLIAIIKEKGKQNFLAVNYRGAGNVARAAHNAGVPQLVHISALGAGPDPKFAYLYSKWEGEQAVKLSGADYTILRPSTVFGPGDGFFTNLRSVLRLSPGLLPIPGDGDTLFQPISAEDVAECVAICLRRGPVNRAIEIGGPEFFTLRDILHLVRDRYTHWPRIEVHIPLPVMAIGSHLPNPFVTPTQVEMLKCSSVTSAASVTHHFGFEPKRLSDNLDYLRDY